MKLLIGPVFKQGFVPLIFPFPVLGNIHITRLNISPETKHILRCATSLKRKRSNSSRNQILWRYRIRTFPFSSAHTITRKPAILERSRLPRISQKMKKYIFKNHGDVWTGPNCIHSRTSPLRHPIQGTPPFRGHKIWSRLKRHFYSWERDTFSGSRNQGLSQFRRHISTKDMTDPTKRVNK